MVGLTAMTAHGQTSSPLEILSHAPKVKIEDPTPTPRPTVRAPEYQQTPATPYVPPPGGAPYIQPVPPHFTPYSGSSASGTSPAQQPYYNDRQGAPAQPMAARTPTPRPVLGPEDVERERSSERKGGIVRGLLRAIPFVGGDDDDEQTPTPAPDAYESPSNGPVYRGFDTDEPANQASPNQQLLRAPGSSPLPPDPEPSSPSMRGNQSMRGNLPMYPTDDTEPGEMTAPPILTPEPRFPPPIGEDMEPLSDTTPANPDAPILTVKRESDETTTESESATPVLPAAPASSASPSSTNLDSAPADDPVSNPSDEKRPGLARPDTDPTPRPLEKATTSVLIQESRPAEDRSDEDNLGPRPDPSAISILPYDPTATPSANDKITSLSIKQSDLGMPNPAYEQNTTILAEFQDSVRKARADDFSGAATGFREYALNHPSSGLAPRAAFLSVIFEHSRSQAKENMESLERLFPESRYVKEAKERRGDEIAKAADTSNIAVDAGGSVNAAEDSPASPVVSTETPAEQIARLEKELTLAIGDPAKEPELRKQLGVLYLDKQEYERAYEVLRPAAEMAEGQKVNGEIMMALGRALVARGETVQAISLYEAVDEKYPGLIESDAASAWSAGLAFEGAGRYTKARTLYNLIRQKWSGTAEANWATARLNDLATLRQ